MILIVGADGSMGKRYQAILKHLNKEFKCADVRDSTYSIEGWAKESEGVIIATPTETHCEFLLLLEGTKKPFLCEKPYSMIPKELEEIHWARQRGLDITMMLQYQFLDNPSSSGPSHYNYFRHGSDGLVWDCFQIIGLARDEISIGESSPIWKCQLNGVELRLGDMDKAYIMAVESWLRGEKQDFKAVMKMHEKVLKFKGSYV